jgi:hypothetical protein
MSKYMGLELIYEDKNVIEPETKSELEHYCTSTINRVCAEKEITDKQVISLMYDRLMEIKLMSNELRPFQNYNVLVHRYRKRTYPNRFVELF